MADDLFAQAASRDLRGRPLAERMRPKKLEDILGQDDLLGPHGALTPLVARGELPSLVFWGPPGCGKTTLARLLAARLGIEVEGLSAVLAGVKELRAAIERAGERRALYRRRTLLFVDEIHRFSRSQQDALLPHVESGVVTLVGATTENPAYELNAALLSRCRVFVLRPLGAGELVALLRRALIDAEFGLGARPVEVPEPLLQAMAEHADGDARRALTTLEVACQICLQAGRTTLVAHDAESAGQTKTLLYDKRGDAHYATTSAFIKSMRGSDPDAALYYMIRMLEAGEPPHFILRRMVIFASEDIGNACPQALQVAVAGLHAFELMGMPEGHLPLTQVVTYLACAPKSHTCVTAYAAAKAAVDAHGNLPVPDKLRNAHTALAKELGHGAAYTYPHTQPGHFSPEGYLPEALVGSTFYEPSKQGEEAAIAARLAAWRAARQG